MWSCLWGREASAEQRAWLGNTSPPVQQPSPASEGDISITSLPAALPTQPQGKLPRAEIQASKTKKLFWLFSVAYWPSLSGQKWRQICTAWGRHYWATSHCRLICTMGLHPKCQQDPGFATKCSCSRQSKKLFREVITTLSPKESGA